MRGVHPLSHTVALKTSRLVTGDRAAPMIHTIIHKDLTTSKLGKNATSYGKIRCRRVPLIRVTNQIEREFRCYPDELVNAAHQHCCLESPLISLA
jgi:hypothetical protein